MFTNRIHISHVNGGFVNENRERRRHTAVCCGRLQLTNTHSAHMRPDESKQVLVQLHFEFRWIVDLFSARIVGLLRLLVSAFFVARKSEIKTFTHTVRILSIGRGGGYRQQRSPGTHWVALTKMCKQQWLEWPVKQWNTSQCERRASDSRVENIREGAWATNQNPWM